jgi:hypothetical protein
MSLSKGALLPAANLNAENCVYLLILTNCYFDLLDARELIIWSI